MKTDERLSRIERICAAYKRGTPVREIASMMGVQSSAIYRNLRTAGVLPPYNPGPKRGKMERRVEAKIEAVAPSPPRDPCPRCGVRGDKGCKHGWKP